MPATLPPWPTSAQDPPGPPPPDARPNPPGPGSPGQAARRTRRALRWAARVARRAAGWATRAARAAWACARLPEPPPAQPAAEGGMLADARRQRAARPPWQRAGFVAMLGLLLAVLLGPDRVVVADLALVLAWSVWVLVGRAGKVVVAVLALWLCWALLGPDALPVVGLAVFARWFLATPSTALVPFGRPGGVDGPAGGRGPHATTPLPAGRAPGGHDLPDPSDQQPVPARPDPGLVARVRAAWPAAAQAAGLAGAGLREVRPALFGWTAVIELRPGQTLDDAVRQQGALESALDAPPGAVRLEQDPTRRRRVRLRVLERDPHAQPVPYPGPTSGSVRRPIALGLSELGEPTAPLLAGTHALLVGTTGSGKSMLLNVLVAELVATADAVVWGIDFTRGAELGPWERHGCLGRVATTPEQAEQLLLAAVAVLDARLEELARRGVRAWPTGPGAPELKVVIDEHAEVVRTCSAAALRAIDSIAERGRKVAVTLVVASLRASMEVLGSDTLRAMLKLRVCLGVEDPGELPLALGLGRGERPRWPAELLDAPGKFFLRAREQGLVAPRVHRGFQFADAHVAQAAARYAGKPASLGELSDRAAARHPAPTPPAPPGSPGGPPPDHRPTGGNWAAPNPPGSPAGWPPAWADDDGGLLAELRAAGPAGLPAAALKDRTGLPHSTLYKRLGELAHAGLVQQLARGHWRATPTTQPTEDDY